jgi:hypothetical protein
MEFMMLMEYTGWVRKAATYTTFTYVHHSDFGMREFQNSEHVPHDRLQGSQFQSFESEEGGARYFVMAHEPLAATMDEIRDIYPNNLV